MPLSGGFRLVPQASLQALLSSGSNKSFERCVPARLSLNWQDEGTLVMLHRVHARPIRPQWKPAVGRTLRSARSRFDASRTGEPPSTATRSLAGPVIFGKQEGS